MSDDLPVVRIDDRDRDLAVAFLRHHCGEGRITLDEFSDRVGAVFAASTTADLALVTDDLPALPTVGSAPAPPRGRVRSAAKWTVSMFSSSQRRGRWRVEGETVAISFMGSCQLDLRQAEVVGDEVLITAIAFMGGVDVIVPEGIEVVLEGFAFMGGKQSSVKEVPVLPGSPLVRVRAFAFMGGVTVRSRRPPGETKRRKDELRADRRAARHQHLDHRNPTQGGPASRRRPPRGLERLESASRTSPPGSTTPPAPIMLRRGIDAVAEDVRDQWPNLRAQVAPEGTVTIFFSDIEGFTSLNERVGDLEAKRMLEAHYTLVRQELLNHRGFEVKVHGDGFMVAFDSAARALRCAQAIQRRQREWSEANPDIAIRVRDGSPHWRSNPRRRRLPRLDGQPRVAHRHRGSWRGDPGIGPAQGIVRLVGRIRIRPRPGDRPQGLVTASPGLRRLLDVIA